MGGKVLTEDDGLIIPVSPIESHEEYVAALKELTNRSAESGETLSYFGMAPDPDTLWALIKAAVNGANVNMYVSDLGEPAMTLVGRVHGLFGHDAEKRFRTYGMDVVAATFYYSGLESIPSDINLEATYCEAIRKYIDKHGEIICDRMDEETLLYSDEEKMMGGLDLFFYPLLFGKVASLDKSGVHFNEGYREFVEEKVLPHLTIYENNLVQGFGEEFEKLVVFT